MDVYSDVKKQCVFLCYIKLILGNRYGPGVSSRASQGSAHPRLKIADVPTHPDLPQTTMGGRILTLHLPQPSKAKQSKTCSFLKSRRKGTLPKEVNDALTIFRITKLIWSNSHFGAAALSAQMMLWCSASSPLGTLRPSLSTV